LSLTTGTYNTGVGIFSLLSVTDGNFCTGVGAGTLLANTADQNTATGAGTLPSDTIGEENTADGTFALFSNTEGNQNTAVGDRHSLTTQPATTTQPLIFSRFIAARPQKAIRLLARRRFYSTPPAPLTWPLEHWPCDDTVREVQASLTTPSVLPCWMTMWLVAATTPGRG